MQQGEAVRAMAEQVQEAQAILCGCSHANGACARCAAKAREKLKLALESAKRAGWRGPDVF